MGYMQISKLGRAICYEGLDNSGKSTISTEVTKWLKLDHGIDAILTKHPGATEAGREIRSILKHSPYEISPNAQALLFAADNSLFMSQVLKPMIEQGKWVISDRNNFISSLAYQISSGCSFDELDKVHAATLQTYQIDLLFIFRCDWETAYKRKLSKVLNEPGRDRYEDGGREYFDKLSKCYDSLMSDHAHRVAKFVKPANGQFTDRLAEDEISPVVEPNVHYIDASREQFSVLNEVKSIIELNMKRWQIH